jgi:branched-chain amino acid transport system ATP-binding protein
MSGQLRASDGKVLIEGQDVTGLSAPRRTRLGLGGAFQLTNLFPRLSVAENVRLGVQARAGVHYDMRKPWRASMDLIRRADAVLDSVGLSGRRARSLPRCRTGDQRKLEGWDVEDMGAFEAARAIEPLCMLWCIPGVGKGDWSPHAFKLLR